MLVKQQLGEDTLLPKATSQNSDLSGDQGWEGGQQTGHVGKWPAVRGSLQGIAGWAPYLCYPVQSSWQG